MDESHARQFFLEPKQTFQRQYEALRAIFVAGEPLDQVAAHPRAKTVRAPNHPKSRTLGS
jgi:hypothetical protein